MMTHNLKKIYPSLCSTSVILLTVVISLAVTGCSGLTGYSSDSLYPQNLDSVYLEMFDNRSFYRGIEYKLTDALAKRIEARTPYKIITSSDRADTIMTGQIESVRQSVLSRQRQTGRALEKQLELNAVVNWKNLKTGQLLIDNTIVTTSASFSEWQKQGFEYASAVAANNLAEKIVELMESQW